MTTEDQERLQELESLLEDEYGDELSEMDEDDRAELKDLRSEAREEKKRAKALAKFDKARTVFRVTVPIIGAGNKPTGQNSVVYALDLTTAREWAGEAGEESNIEEIDRKSLTGKFAGGEVFYDTACSVCGTYPDAGQWRSCPDCSRPVCSKCLVDVDDGHWGYWGCPSCMAVAQEYEAQRKASA